MNGNNQAHPVPVIVAILVLASSLLVGCAPHQPYSADDVSSSFYSIAKAQTLPERQEILRWWSAQIVLGEVKYIKEKDIYSLEFPDMELKGVEIWSRNMKSSKIWPENTGALLSAAALFCRERKDYESYLNQVKTLKRSQGK